MVPKAFIQYLVHFHGDRDYFECHEVLEDYWKEVDSGNKESIWVGFIQLAVSSYHYRRGNFSGALRTHNKSAAILTSQPQKCTQLGINYSELIKLMEERKAKIISRQPYRSIDLPVDDQVLMKQCLSECEKLKLHWGKGSNTLDKTLVDKHLMRDRSDVILERERAIEERENKKRQ
ncbi:DUF309 domain-containing protein [Mesobacillus maritimus]|uniref:DUF309 domain-containing protein n=1 Tax=Mesobacillus maritimus TaxID=1643336 RepID=A0ABS7K2W8_9BACI|nr:DUF309 domain-containing protein [Mesobacillus maritimus]MBY0096495.1 DUF309 domain-containing protein [Mesobacillus maritimus]